MLLAVRRPEAVPSARQRMAQMVGMIQRCGLAGRSVG